jgi:four helix bundle protein
MATFKRFEDIEAWKKARVLTKTIYSLTATGKFYRDIGLREQIRRASVSVMSNIAEGFNRRGRKEFIQFLSIAKGSVGEVQSQLYVALDMEYITEEAFTHAYKHAEEINAMLYGLIVYLSKGIHNDIMYAQAKTATTPNIKH